MDEEQPTRRRRVRARPAPAAKAAAPAAPNAKPRRRRQPAAKPAVDAPPFQSLYFGRAAAETEVKADPERFRRTYLELNDLPRRVAAHERFLILGPKGAGKSAAAHYVAETWRDELGPSAVFITAVDFDELNRTQTPLASLDKHLVSPDVMTMTDSAWRLFIGVRLLESLVNDQACSLAKDSQAIRFLSDLGRVGLASDDYPQVLRTVRGRKGGFSLKTPFGGGAGEQTSTDTDSMSPGQVADALTRLVLTAETPNRHLLMIDGLDKAITENDSYWLTIGALIRVADDIRQAAVGADASNVYLLLMCRSDVFRRVRFADAPKIAADGGVYLGWHAEAAEPRDVLLWDYLAKKADVKKETLWAYLPASVRVGEQGGVATLRYLLDFTRYTPRDMSLLFGHLQDACTGDKLTGTEVRRAADAFASQHLLSEIVAEAVGLLPDAAVDRLESVIGSFPRRILTRRQLQKIMAEQGLTDVLTDVKLGEYLFLQGAIGNYKPDAGYVQFFHRRDAAKYQVSGPWVLHTGLVYALNVPWSGT